MNARSAPMWWGLAGVAVAALVVVPLAVGDDDDGAAGFDGYIQSGTCADPSDELMVDLEGDDDAERRRALRRRRRGRRAGHPRLLRRPRGPRLQRRGDLHRPAVLDGDHRPRHRRRRSPAATSSSPTPTGSAKPAWRWCSCSRSGRAASRGSRPSSGPASSGSWTSRRPEPGSSSPPRPSPCRPRRQPGTRGTSRAGGASRRHDDLRVESESEDDYDVAPVRGRVRRGGRPRHGRVLRVGRCARLRSGRRLHRPGLLGGHRGPRIGPAGRVRRHPRTGRPTSSPRPGWRSCSSSRPVTPGCRATPSSIGWRCSVSSTSPRR